MEPDAEARNQVFQPWGAVSSDPAEPTVSGEDPAIPQASEAPRAREGEAKPSAPHSTADAGDDDIPVAVFEDGTSVRISGKVVPARNNVVDTVLNSLAAFARAADGPVSAVIDDLRPGGYRQRVRVYADGRSDLLWAGDEPRKASAVASDTAATGRCTSAGRTGELPERREAEQQGAHESGTGELAVPGQSPYASDASPSPAPQPPSTPPTSPDVSQAPAQPTASAPGLLPTVNDLLGDGSGHGAPAGQRSPARQGWRRLLKLPPSGTEQADRLARQSVQRNLNGPKTIVVINPKGGAHKTTATLLLAAAFGTCRGGYTLAWDNNETRGTMGWRSLSAPHQRTAVHLLRDVERIANTPQVGVGDLDPYIRPQGDAQFDVLASDESPDSWSVVDGAAFQRLHTLLTRFYRVLLVDTGNNMRAENWTAAVDAADALVVVSTIREDTAASAAWMIDALRNGGHHHKIANAVTILSAPGPKADKELSNRLTAHFRQHTRDVVRVPYDPALVDGDRTLFTALAPGTRAAWLQAAAAVSVGL